MKKIARWALSLMSFALLNQAQAQDFDLNPPWSVDFSFGGTGMTPTIDPGRLVGDSFILNDLVRQSSGHVVHAQVIHTAKRFGFSIQRYDALGYPDPRFAQSSSNRYFLDSTDGNPYIGTIELVKDSADRLYVAILQQSTLPRDEVLEETMLSARLVVCALSAAGDLRTEFGRTRRDASLPDGCISAGTISQGARISQIKPFQIQVDRHNNLIIAGATSLDTSVPMASNRWFIERMNGDGVADRSFGTSGNGRVELAPPSFSGIHSVGGRYYVGPVTLDGLAIDENASVYLSGRASVILSSGDTLSLYTSLGFFHKLDIDGRLNNTFGLNGRVAFADEQLCSLFADYCTTREVFRVPLIQYRIGMIALDANRRLLTMGTGYAGEFCLTSAVGRVCPTPLLSRIDANTGRVDGDFGTNGMVQINAQLPDPRVMTAAGIERARLSYALPFEILTSVEKGEYAILSGQWSFDLLNTRKPNPGGSMHLIMHIDAQGRVRNDVPVLRDFGSAAPSNCQFAAPGPIMYGDNARNLYVYTEGARCSGSLLTIDTHPAIDDNPWFYISRIFRD